MPSCSTTGEPPAKTAMSVVVPPMSKITESWLMSHRAMMPMTLAAGPEKIDCTGMRRAREKGLVPPSALSMLTLIPARPRRARLCSTASAKALYRRQTAQLKKAVATRRGKLSRPPSSWPMTRKSAPSQGVVSRPLQTSRLMVRSCTGFLIENLETAAKTLIPAARQESIAALTWFWSSPRISLPRWSMEPSRWWNSLQSMKCPVSMPGPPESRTPTSSVRFSTMALVDRVVERLSWRTRSWPTSLRMPSSAWLTEAMRSSWRVLTLQAATSSALRCAMRTATASVCVPPTSIPSSMTAPWARRFPPA